MAKNYYEQNGRNNSRLYAVLGVVVVLVAIGFGAGLFLGSSDPGQPEQATTIDYGELYEGSADSVVSIMVVTEDGQTGGSGFVYDANQHIVTNAHVVAEAEEVYVQYSSGDWVSAQVVGGDVDSDLAVVKVESTPETAEPMQMAEENPARGESVMIVGSPMDLEQSVSQGIVTGAGRELQRDNGFVIPDIIQTDASVNPGNSGGPVLNPAGDVVGVVTAKQGDNIGFAISPELVNVIVPQLIEHGSVDHSYVGIRSVDNGPLVAQGNNYTETRGIALIEVVEGSPADGVLQAPNTDANVESAGGVLIPEAGDVLVGIDGVEIRTGEDLSSYLMKYTEPGDTVSVTLIRDGEEQTVEMTLGNRPE